MYYLNWVKYTYHIRQRKVRWKIGLEYAGREMLSLVAAAFKLNIIKNLHWVTGIKTKLEQIGMLDMFLYQDLITHLFCYQRQNDICHQNALLDIKRDSSKLKTYSLLKKQIGYKNYLSIIQNINHRM